VSYPGDEADLDAVCEYLGLVDDAESHATYSTEAHRCYRLPNPTRIASAHQERFCLGANHVDCPVFRGEGVAQTTRTATAPPPPPPQREAEPAGAVRDPEQPPARRQQQRPRRDPGTLGPRPRPGGISMPAATIGLLGLAIAIVGLAFITQQILSGNGDSEPPLDTLGTQQALEAEATQTAAAMAPGETPDDGTDAVEPGDDDGLEPDPDVTPDDADVPDGDITYTVQPGDTCFGLATEYGTTVDEIVAANPDLDEDCALIAGTDIIIPQ
jgi:hypothetical protein